MNCTNHDRLPPRNPEPPIGVKQQAFQAWLASAPDRSRFAIATQYADRLDIFTREGRHVGRGDRVLNFEPVFTTEFPNGSPTMGLGDDSRIGFVDVVATESRIFALRSGKLLAEDGAWFGQYVHEYDWNGGLRRIFELPVRTVSLAVSPDGSRLFVIQSDPLPAIVQFDLP
jgi:hypothetical protein